MATGEAEASALLKEINKQKAFRPLTHDLTKHLLQAVGFRVLKIRITELVRPVGRLRGMGSIVGCPCALLTCDNTCCPR